MDARSKLDEYATLNGWDKNKLIGWSEAADFAEWLVKKCNTLAVSNNEVAVEPEKHKCINCGKEYEDIDDAIMCCYVSETDC